MTSNSKLKALGILISLLLIWIPFSFWNGKIIASIILGIIAIGEFIR